MIGPAFEEFGFEAPKLLEGLVVELQAAVGVEDRDRRCQMVQRIGMALERSGEFFPKGLGRGDIDRHAAGTCRTANIDHVEVGARAAHGCRDRVVKG